MKYALFLLILLKSGLLKPPHDIPLAIYDLRVAENNSMKMSIQFDKQDLEKAIKASYKLPVTTSTASKYLQENSEWLINEKRQDLTICSSWNKEDHFVLEVEFPLIKEPIISMSIFNTCLVKEIDNHSNIIYLHYQGDLRGFRLSKERVQTTFNFLK